MFPMQLFKYLAAVVFNEGVVYSILRCISLIALLNCVLFGVWAEVRKEGVREGGEEEGEWIQELEKGVSSFWWI